MKLLKLVAVLLLLVGCARRSETATDVLIDAGYRGITINNWQPWSGCGDPKDRRVYSTQFDATAKNSKHVSGHVCMVVQTDSRIVLQD